MSPTEGAIDGLREERDIALAQLAEARVALERIMAPAKENEANGYHFYCCQCKRVSEGHKRQFTCRTCSIAIDALAKPAPCAELIAAQAQLADAYLSAQESCVMPDIAAGPIVRIEALKSTFAAYRAAKQAAK